MKFIKIDRLIFASLIFAVLFLVFGIFAVEFPFVASRGKEIVDSKLSPDARTVKENIPIIKSIPVFFDSEVFFPAIEQAKSIKKMPDIRAIIVPHHLVASEYIAKLIRQASGRTIKNIVIIGPNHENLGTAPVSTLEAGWETPFGTIEHDDKLVKKFLADYSAKSYPEIFANEHSVGAIMPFVKYYLNEAKVMPIIISSYARYNDMDKLKNWLLDNLDDNSLIIYSLDFSHYLEKDEADSKDCVTRELIINKDIGKIFNLNNDYVDSPAILALSLMFAEKEELKTNIIYQGNSYDFAVVKPLQTTSYFAVSFTVPE